MNIEIAPHILRDLAEVAAQKTPSLSTERGDLYIHPRLGMGAISLKVPAGEYLQFLDGLDESFRPTPSMILPQKDARFDLYVNGALLIKDGKVFLNQKEVILI